MDLAFVPVLIALGAVGLGYLSARAYGYRSLIFFGVTAAIGYAICGLSAMNDSGQWAGLGQFLIALFVITPALIGTVIGCLIGGYRKGRKAAEDTNAT